MSNINVNVVPAYGSYTPGSLWTGGVTTTVAGLKLGVWYESQEPITFNKFYAQSESSQSSGVILELHDDYYFWKSNNLSMALPFICEAPFKEIGCLEHGVDYQGNASRSKNGDECLPWNSPDLTPMFTDQSNWNNNYCRNPDGLEEMPYCYIDEHNIEPCIIPECGDRVDRSPEDSISDIELKKVCDEAFPKGRDDVDVHDGHHHNYCPPEQFQCLPGECIYSQFVCDGESDCSNGLDENNCLNYTSLYMIEKGFKLKTDENPKIGMTEEECAKACAQSKRCACDSFSYNAEKKRCLLGNIFSNAPFDSLLERKAWNYYSFNGTHDSNCRVTRPAHTEIEGLRLINGGGDDSTVNIVHVKINGTWGGICDDGFSINEANVICRQLGYDLGAEIVKTGQGNNHEDHISLYDMTCTGDEPHISDCHFGDHSAHNHICVGTEKAGIKCRKAEKKCDEGEFHCKNKECINVNDLCDGTPHCGDQSDEETSLCSKPFQIRLVGGPSQNGRVGRVEIRHKGVWGTVCDDNFHNEEAKVVCRMMGFPTANAMVYNGNTDYEGDGPVWIRLTDDKTCSGNESSLTECKEKHLWEHDHGCNHMEDVAVSCEDFVQDRIYLAGNDEHTVLTNPSDTHNDVITFGDPEGMLTNEATHSLEGPSVDCGRQRLNMNRGPFLVAPRIRQGEDSFCGEHPWQASIRVRGYQQNYHWCGATIISRFYLITAAHCLKEFPQSTYHIRVGDCNLDVHETEEAEYEIDEIRFHENYNVGPYLNNDIAIVKVKTNDSNGMDFGQYVSPVCLPSPALPYPKNFNLTITGWGKTGPDSEYRHNVPEQNEQGAVITLQKADVPILLTNKCESAEVNHITFFYCHAKSSTMDFF